LGQFALNEAVSDQSNPYRIDRPIVLVGLMGVGKSTDGRRLARQLKLPFFDADAEIEAAASASVEEIFARHGEAAFRDGERRVIARLVSGPPIVLSTGGGAFIDPITRALILEKAFSIWLKADLELLLKRVSKRGGRPLLKGGDPRKIMADLMERRYPIYAEADLVVESRGGPHEHVVMEILTALRAHFLNVPAP
jgi:shikimate kinase